MLFNWTQLIDKSRDYLGLGDLEKPTMDGGVLNIHIGDVFSPDAAISGGYAGKDLCACKKSNIHLVLLWDMLPRSCRLDIMVMDPCYHLLMIEF